MTARAVYVLQCDHPGCHARYTAADPSAMATRSIAAGEGWSYRSIRRHQGPARSVDLCPGHAEHIAEATA